MAALDVQPGAVADREALAKMAIAVLGRVRDAGAPRMTDLARWIEETPRAWEFPGELSERLFAAAEPLPISASTPPSGPIGRPSASGGPRRILVAESSPPARTDNAVHGWMPGWAAELMTEGPDAVKRRVLDFVRGVRPRFWVIASGVALALILAISLVPAGTKADVAPAATPSRSTVPSELPIPSASALPADPLLAAAVLLKARQICLRDLSILCLDGVDEDSAGAFESDSTLIQKIEDGGRSSEADRPGRRRADSRRATGRHGSRSPGHRGNRAVDSCDPNHEWMADPGLPHGPDELRGRDRLAPVGRPRGEGR
jgi:hypothetical protein